MIQCVAQSFLVACLCVLGSGCSNDSASQPERDETRALTSEELKLAAASESFGFRLLKEAVAAEDEANVLLSPVSVHLAVSMAYNGAVGPTKNAMEASLELYGLSESELCEGFENLMGLLTNKDSSTTMRIANSIWYRTDFSVKNAFLETNRQYFKAAVHAADFDNPAAARRMNDWVSNATNAKITEIVRSPIDPRTMMLLINAVYFNGTWSTEFDAEKTAEAPFTLTDRSTVSVPMMYLETSLPYAEDDLVQMVELPYGNGRFHMSLLLPKPGADMDSLLDILDVTQYRDWLGDLEPKMGEVYLPRFALSYRTSLNSVLASLGMELAFDPSRADFSGIADVDKLHISQVIHKTFIAVNEMGTEAAAATGIEVGITSVGPRGFVFRADHPFLFVIRETSGGGVIFAGVVRNPAD